MGGHHHGHHHGHEGMGIRRLFLAVAVNVGLTVVQVIGGLISGSLSLIADALHNFGDAGALLLALVARRIAHRPADDKKTFGYDRAEVVGALINLTTLVLIGLYLIYEAVMRYFEPQEISGWIVVAVAGAALAVDLVTAALTYTLSKESINIKAAFLHNVSDALASVGVIIAGTLIILYDWYIVDSLVTLLIAGYVLYQGLSSLPRAINILMQSVPPDIDRGDVVAAMEKIDGVENVHHVHIWEIGEGRASLEAHIIVSCGDLEKVAAVKSDLKKLLRHSFQIDHSTLEFELGDYPCADEAGVAPHAGSL